MGFIAFLLVAAAGGVIGGMGMGGGTVLIPLLALIFSVEQHTAQAVNLIAFIPMAIAALAVHTKNGYVDYKGGLKLIIPALIFAALGSVASHYVSAALLRKLFGLFLIVLSAVQFFGAVKKKKND